MTQIDFMDRNYYVADSGRDVPGKQWPPLAHYFEGSGVVVHNPDRPRSWIKSTASVRQDDWR